MTRYFPDARFSEGNRPLFAFAAYNAGPGNIARMRRETVKRGLDPDKWFNNVEVVVAEKIGMPPGQVFKTLVARGDRCGVIMACIPANAELDL